SHERPHHLCHCPPAVDRAPCPQNCRDACGDHCRGRSSRGVARQTWVLQPTVPSTVQRPRVRECLSHVASQSLCLSLLPELFRRWSGWLCFDVTAGRALRSDRPVCWTSGILDRCGTLFGSQTAVDDVPDGASCLLTRLCADLQHPQ